MTLDQRIETLLKTDIGCSECGDVAADELRTNLKQAFERGEIAFVPSEDDIMDILNTSWREYVPYRFLEICIKNDRNKAKAIIALLTKGKENGSNIN